MSHNVVSTDRHDMELLTLEQAANTLGISVAKVLEHATLRRLTIGTVTRKGTMLFLVAEDIHRFLADPGATVKTSDLKLTYNECPDPDSNYMPAPNGRLGPPVSDVTIRTLRITQKEVARAKKDLSIQSASGATIRHFGKSIIGVLIVNTVSFLKSHILGIILIGISCSLVASYIYGWLQQQPVTLFSPHSTSVVPPLRPAPTDANAPIVTFTDGKKAYINFSIVTRTLKEDAPRVVAYAGDAENARAFLEPPTVAAVYALLETTSR